MRMCSSPLGAWDEEPAEFEFVEEGEGEGGDPVALDAVGDAGSFAGVTPADGSTSWVFCRTVLTGVAPPAGADVVSPVTTF